MSTIYIVRHGQSEGNVDPTLYSKKKNENVELTPLGKKQIENVRHSIIDDMKGKKSPLAIFTSPFKRCTQTSEIIAQGFGVSIRPNLLLSEINCGEQQGCEAEDFVQRPTEKHYYDTLGSWQYNPHRGESLIEVHVRTGLFVVQNHFFQYHPQTIIVSHASTCLMMHYFLTNSCPVVTDTLEKAISYWPNGLAKKYETPGYPTTFVHTGDLYATAI